MPLERGTIVLQFDGISKEETERYRQIFEALFASGGMNVRSGQTTLHFDFDGQLRLIETHEQRWRKKTSEAVVAKNVPPGVTVVGNPAVDIRTWKG